MMQRPKIWLTVSIISMVVSVVLILLVRPVWGIDFTGGSLLEVVHGDNSSAAIQQLLKNKFDLDTTVQPAGEDSLIIRTTPMSHETHTAVVNTLLEEKLIASELRFESIGPTIGAELRRKAWLTVSCAIVALILYLAYAFRQTGGLVSSWKLSVAAVIATVHDLLVVTALFVVLGRLFGAPVDTLFVSAMLAILGYSVHDTIVLFNRLQTEWLATRTGSLLDITEKALKATMIRSLNSSITTLLVLITLLIFGGTTIRWFIVALAAGTIVGAYSSFFVAPPLLYAFTRRS